jgi:hypothetical protein
MRTYSPWLLNFGVAGEDGYGPKERNQMPYSIKDHFANKDASVKAIYDAILRTAESWGPVTEEAKKTSIHLIRKTAFAGVATRKSSLILTIKSETDLKSRRIAKRQQTSRSRWYLDLKLESPEAIDPELTGWLKSSYELSE